MKLSDLFRFFRRKSSPSDDEEKRARSGEKRLFGGEQRGFLFRTRGDSDPYGKPKVYFTCHPDDFLPYFDEIAEDIFETQNCVICYKDPDLTYTENELRDLISGSFELMVIPVTSKLLNQSNSAMDVEFPIALEAHIPVLPLMQETGLDQRFAERFGTLHYLNKNLRDSTAISYDEKLRTYLDKILVSDDGMDKIRDAFDAYIFLSYRKKDRREAQELMRLIHSSDVYRDVAIWYDEFLVPGESFSESIARMLIKSDMFLLAVSPNLVNEDNYVRQVEYPAAKKQGKKILPAAIRSINSEEFQRLVKNFPGISECVDMRSAEELFAALKQLLGGIALREKLDNPIHNFFIGLAYLKGVDVEIDHDRAVKLITSAADSGLPEAMRKLSAMYGMGEGVPRDFERCVEWLEKLEKSLARQYEAAPDAVSGRALYDCLTDLEEAYRNAGHRNKAVETCGRAIAFASDASFPWSAEAKARSLLNKGYYCYEDRDFMAAERCYDEARAGLRASFDLAILYERKSLLAKRAGETEKAERWLAEALKIREKLAGPGSKASVKSSLALSYLMMGDLVRSDGSARSAEPYYRKALNMFEALARETRHVRDRDGLEVCCCALAEIADDPRQRKQYYQKAFEILSELAEETGSRELLLKKAICEINLTGKLVIPPDEKHPDGEVISLGGRNDVEATSEGGRIADSQAREKARQLLSQAGGAGALAGKKHYLAAMDVIRAVASREEKEEDLKAFHEACAGAAEAFTAEGDWNEAARLWAEAYDTARLIISRYGAPAAGHRDKYRDALMTGIAMKRNGRNDEARKWFGIVHSDIHQAEFRCGGFFMDQKDGLKDFRSINAEACLQLARLTDDDDTMTALCDECLETLHKIYEQSSDGDQLYDLAHAYYIAGQMNRTGDSGLYYGEAIHFCGKGIDAGTDADKFSKLRSEAEKALRSL